MASPSDRRPLVISGPSGVGKGTLIKMLFSRHPDTFTLSVSHTTRNPREGETDGVEYHFVTKDAFRDLIAKDGFVEHAQFGSNLYGTSKATIEEQTAKGKVVVLDIEMEGVKQVKASSIDARYVFVSPPDTEELEKRLRGRGTETEESIQQRLTRAQDELAWAKNAEFDKILVNDDLEKTYQELDAFVYNMTQRLAFVHSKSSNNRACFSFAQKAIPDILEETKWSCPEAGELNAWAYHFEKYWEVLQQLSRCQGSGLVLTSFLYSVKQIRNIAVHRQPITVYHLFMLMSHAINFCICLDVPKALDMIRKMRNSTKTQIQKLEDCKKNIEQGLSTASQETPMTRLEI
ncbi:guanylate kinase [Fusarium acutatum]|uniref:Guanylate kinase n=1 Tax=Fusarium acutatum TaxID=78861 RepID=A0A8H4K175_9HYPO|nr:guanylate kinase [Fusarium acutatum]